jgi:phage terminase large subunit
VADLVVNLPAHGWRPRNYQRPAWAALEAGCLRLALAWHRRAGKDDLSLHWAAKASQRRIGSYWHMLPMASQARKAIWDAVNPRTGRRRIDDAFPMEMRAATREQDMFIRFKNGSTWQVVGSDNFNALVGSPPVGVVFSEYALADPNAWAFLRPILTENGGWAIFISTPRGRNHFAGLLEFALKDPYWFGQVLTIADTGAISMAAVEQERRELVAEHGEQEAKAIIDQEYYCDLDAAIPGSYYGTLMAKALREGRIGLFPHIPTLPVGTAWDLGHADSTVIWMYQQQQNGRVRLIDVIEGSGVGIDWYARRLGQRDYVFADHIWPHDGGHGNIRDIGGTTLDASAKKLGVRPLRILDRDPNVATGIGAVRAMLPLCEFNTDPLPFADETPEQATARMTRALNALRQYRREWDEKLRKFKDAPLHDWTSHTADALRYLARGRKPFRDLAGNGLTLPGRPATAVRQTRILD